MGSRRFFRAVHTRCIRKRYRRTSFCVTLKGATNSYPQEVPSGIPFLFLCFFLLLLRFWSVRSGFFCPESPKYVLFSWLWCAGTVKRQRKWLKREKYRKTYNRTTLLLPRNRPSSQSRRTGICVGGASKVRLNVFSLSLWWIECVPVFFSGFFSAFSSGSLWHKGFSTERRAVRSFNFRDFYRDFMGLPGFYDRNRNRVRRTVSYADTVLQAHVQTKASDAT